MANNAYTQQALAVDPHFRSRVAAALSTVAWQVIEEPESTADHDKRESYARNLVLPNLVQEAAKICTWIVKRPNVMAFETSYDFALGAVVTASGDADIEAQLAADWNVLAGV